MTLKREIKDAYIEGGNSIYVKTHSNAIYVDENETETLTQRLDNVKSSITEHTSQLNDIAKYYVKNNSDVNILTSTIQSYLDEALTGKSIELIFSDNETYITNTLYLRSNTKITLGENTIIKPSIKNSISFSTVDASKDSETTSYNGNGNIEIHGGVFTDSTSIALMHSTYVSIKNVKFNDFTTHAIQIAGCKDIYIEKCKFNGQYEYNVDRNYVESIQIDSTDYDSLKILAPGDTAYDGTPNSNINIIECEFDTSSNNTIRACIGGHVNNAQQHSGIHIEKCIFKNSSYSAIVATRWKDSWIKNCTFDSNNNDIIEKKNVNVNYSTDNFKIINNTFINTINDSIYYYALNLKSLGIHILNNNFIGCNSSSGNTINLYNFTSININKNTFINCASNGNIFNIQDSNSVEFSVNDIDNCKRCIYTKNCENVDISDNKIKNISRDIGVANIVTNFEFISNRINKGNITSDEALLIYKVDNFTITKNHISSLTSESVTPIITISRADSITGKSIYERPIITDCINLVNNESFLNDTVKTNSFITSDGLNCVKIFNGSTISGTINLTESLDKFSMLFVITGEVGSGTYMTSPVIFYNLNARIDDKLVGLTFDGKFILTVTDLNTLTINNSSNNIRSIYGIFK